MKVKVKEVRKARPRAYTDPESERRAHEAIRESELFIRALTDDE